MKTKILITTVLILTIKSMTFAQWSNLWTNNGIYTSCFATSKDTCYVTGGSGQIYRTTNGGATWDSTQTIFNTSWFLDIYFPSANIGYACGGTAFGTHQSIVAKTINGGVTWDSLTSNMFGYDLLSSYFINDTIGFFGGQGTVVKTIDGGQTFTSNTFFFGNVNDFFFTSLNTGIMVAGIQILRTIDQGLNWNVVYTDTTGINSVTFINSNNGFAVGNKGALLKTIDGGNTWSKTIIANDTTFLQDIQFLNNSVGYIAASKFQVGNEGYIYKTTDGGNTWTQQFLSVNVPLSSISMVTADTGYAVGYTSVFKTTNGGTTSINELLFSEQPFTIYPNPFSSSTTLYTDKFFNNATLTIYNSHGQTIKQLKNISGQTVTLHRDNLAIGLYFVRLTQDRQVIATKKLVITD